ncbi:DUF3889 domain-containing protein [Cytobacillus gottheilii]|uniref:DUF3889 domain-containing protein n=1 Tax=Cytobacillus gottheilii TaxID=859144 RepID=UPI0009B9BB1D|nr:DUF3889 domain-containing protein [Cytobacillus gottheilii]
MTWTKSVFLIFSFIFAGDITSLEPMANNQVVIQDGYAKWGRLAVKSAKKKFPNAQMVDYRYDGRVDKDKIAIEQFTLWAKEGEEEFGVIVMIEVDQKTNKLIKIDVNKKLQ